MRCIYFAVVVMIALATVAEAGPLEEATAAYNRGDNALAARLFRQLGSMYAEGHGVKRDAAHAYMWFTISEQATKMCFVTTPAPGPADYAGESCSDGDKANNLKKNVTSRMTGAQIMDAQKMARRCQETKFKECD